MEPSQNYTIKEIEGSTVVVASRFTLIADFISEIESKLVGKVAPGTTVYLWQPETAIPNRVFACKFDGDKLGLPEVSKTELECEEFFKSMAA